MTGPLLRVCLVEGWWHPGQWSMRLYTEEVLSLLQSLPDRVLAEKVAPSPSIGGPAWLRDLPGYHRFARRWSQWRDLPRRLARLEADVYHCMEPADVLATRNIDPSRVVVTWHDLIPWRLKGMLRRSPLTRRLHDRSYRGMVERLRRTACILTPSEQTRRDVMEFAGLPPNMVRTVPYRLNPLFAFVPADRRPSYREQIRSRYSLPAGPLLLHVGSALFYKNIENLLRALAVTSRNLRPKPLLLRAGTPLEKSQSRLAAQLHLTSQIIELGPLSPEGLSQIYPACDALVFPSWYEGFGRPVLEAMACGTPVIASQAGALPEASGGAAVPVDPSDVSGWASAMRRVLEDAGLRARLMEQGRKRAEFYRRTDVAATLYSVYESTRKRHEHLEG